MSDSLIVDFDQDYVILNTSVTVGKSYKSKGWALSRKDIHDWIPVEIFERDCKLIIGNFSSDAVLRFNPRLFYKNDELAIYLKELYDKGCYKSKIPMQIKINKKNLFYNVEGIEKYFNIDYIDTQLLVGKSYKSKGWQLSKDVVSKIFPLENYADNYLIYINDIESIAQLNTQFRIFYNNNELSDYLEELYYKNAQEKISAKIVFEDNSCFNDWGSNKIDESRDNNCFDNINTNSCVICGENYNFKSDFPMGDSDSPYYCPDCVKKLYVLENYFNLKNSSLSKFIKKEHVKDQFGVDFNRIWDLLLEYEFLIPFGDLFKLNGNEFIENSYSKYLNNANLTYNSNIKERNRNKILELVSDEENKEKRLCDSCGVVLTNFETDKCELCMDKSFATEYLHDIVTQVPYGKSFSKEDIISLGVDSLKADLYIEKLIKYRLLISIFDNNYKLNNVTFLNKFIGKYSNSPYGLEIDRVMDDSDVLEISKDDLSSEIKIDALVKWNNYRDFISFKRTKYGSISVQFKQDGAFLYSKLYPTYYEAKIEAIHYLKSFDKIKLVDNVNVNLKFK